MKLQLCSDQMLVTLDETPPDNGLIIAANAPPQHCYGTVIAVGPGRFDHGAWCAMPCIAGDRVFMHPNPGQEVKVEGGTYRLVHARDLIGVEPQ